MNDITVGAEQLKVAEPNACDEMLSLMVQIEFTS